MTITVNNQLRVERPSPALEDWCKKNLIVANPEYGKKVRMHLWLGNTPKWLQLYERDGETLVLPYGCLRSIIEFMDEQDAIEVVMPTPVPVWYGAEVPLYDYQGEAVASVLESQYGILQSPADRKSVV